jgi:DivIVA domain-containing protein
VNGDEVRRLVLPTAERGYDPAAVEDLLDRVAAELDAGRPVTPLIETATFPLQRTTSWQDFKREMITHTYYPHFLTGGPL